jgi:hypothetical protein
MGFTATYVEGQRVRTVRTCHNAANIISKCSETSGKPGANAKYIAPGRTRHQLSQLKETLAPRTVSHNNVQYTASTHTCILLSRLI